MIVLAVAILPMLGMGGIQLIKAETAGAIKTSKLTPRIAETAKYLWFIYIWGGDKGRAVHRQLPRDRISTRKTIPGVWPI